MTKFRKKPVEVEAVQYNGENINEIEKFVGNSCLQYDAIATRYFIKTLEGNMYLTEGDYIIKGVEGEFYPCKPDIFKKTYDSVIEGEEIVRVLRVIEYVGTRKWVEATLEQSIKGTKHFYKGGTIKAETIGDYPEILNKEEE